jgi:hypothetical protein
VLEPFVPLDTRHLSMPLLCRRRPENPHCCWLSDPRVRWTHLRRGDPHACFDESPRLAPMLPRRVWAPTTSWREMVPTRLPQPARMLGRVEPLQALNTPGKASPNM